MPYMEIITAIAVTANVSLAIDSQTESPVSMYLKYEATPKFPFMLERMPTIAPA